MTANWRQLRILEPILTKNEKWMEIVSRKFEYNQICTRIYYIIISNRSSIIDTLSKPKIGSFGISWFSCSLYSSPSNENEYQFALARHRMIAVIGFKIWITMENQSSTINRVRAFCWRALLYELFSVNATVTFISQMFSRCTEAATHIEASPRGYE